MFFSDYCTFIDRGEVAFRDQAQEDSTFCGFRIHIRNISGRRLTMVLNTATHVAFIIMLRKELSYLQIPMQLEIIGATGDDEVLLAVLML